MLPISSNVDFSCGCADYDTGVDFIKVRIHYYSRSSPEALIALVVVGSGGMEDEK